MRPFGRNPRRHDPAQVRKLCRSIDSFGFTSSLVIDEDNRLLAGHGRLLAAQQLQLDSVPCIVVQGLSTEQKKALAIADNRIALDATWDEDALVEILGEIAQSGLDTLVTGFEAPEITNLLAPAAPAIETMPDDPDSEADQDYEPAQVITISVANPIDIPSVAAILRKTIRRSGLSGVVVHEPR